MTDTRYFPSFLTRPRLVHIVGPNRAADEEMSVVLRLEGFDTALSYDPSGFLEAARRRVPDAVLINLRQEGMSGVELIRLSRAQRRTALLFLIEEEPEIHSAVDAVKAGAADVFTRPVDIELLVRRLREELRKGVELNRGEAQGPSVEGRGLPRLTPRERQVLDLISNGQSNKQAGRELGISPRTIEVHRARVMEKLGARNTAELLRILLTP